MDKRTLNKVYRRSIFTDRAKDYVITFDLDKTYLDTEFETLSGLLKIPFESAHKKKNIPGSDSVVRELRRSGKDFPRALFFISGSPTRMENVIRQKLAIDKVEFDGILLKNFSAAIRKFQFKKLIDKVGFKLSALLYGRSVYPLETDEILFGDDSEYDATIYSLYSDIIAGNLSKEEVLTILRKWNIYHDEIETIDWALDNLEYMGWIPRKAVAKIFIHMETGSTPRDFLTFSEKITPTYNYFQTAIILQNEEFFTRFGIYRVISDLINIYEFQQSDFQQSLEDLILRDMLEIREAKRILRTVKKAESKEKLNLFLPGILLDFKNIIKTSHKLKKKLPSGFFQRKNPPANAFEKYINITLERRV